MRIIKHHCLLYLAFLLFLLANHITMRAQEKSETIIVKGDDNACELNSLYLDNLRMRFMSQDNQRVFVIARLGSKETSTRLNRLRLNSVKIYTVVSGRFPKEMTIFAEGERAEGEGRIEFYLGSRLYLVALVAPGKNICLTCCDDSYVPSKNNRGKKARR